jgi:argininosuccinate lyase
MPQKRNPDMAELTRGKTGRLYGNLMSILTTMKALPFSYNRDMQGDKHALFDSVDTVHSALEDLAEYLVTKGMPFRKAYAIIGNIVAQSAANQIPLNQVSLAELKKFSPLLDRDVAKIF